MLTPIRPTGTVALNVRYSPWSIVSRRTPCSPSTAHHEPRWQVRLRS
jgi:hypothetical protein